MIVYIAEVARVAIHPTEWVEVGRDIDRRRAESLAKLLAWHRDIMVQWRVRTEQYEQARRVRGEVGHG